MIDRKKRKEKVTIQRRKQIIKAALVVFSEKGYAEATIPEIAKKAGIATGTIYLYFPSKRELFIAMAKDTIITPPLINLIGKIPTGNFADVFKQILLDRFQLIESDAVACMPALIGEAQRDPVLRDLWLEDFMRPFFQRMEMGYGILSASGKARRMEPAITVRMVGGMILGFLILRLLEGETSPLNHIPREKVAEHIVSFVLHGLMNDMTKDVRK